MIPIPAEVQAEINYSRLVNCLEEVEGNEWSAPGGKLGWTIAAWQEETHRPYAQAQDRYHARLLAMLRLIRMRGELAKRGFPNDIATLAQVWRSGLTGVLSGKPKEPDYGERVKNLYYDRSF